ncbi:Calx-beta domain-containing protein [Phenylobacterium sp.]|uniref:Calx-beta domain-containing protein n=1 Tax=Phenylobacterium sp. TaxID=1871053 RepID=UPI002F95F3B5
MADYSSLTVTGGGFDLGAGPVVAASVADDGDILVLRQGAVGNNHYLYAQAYNAQGQALQSQVAIDYNSYSYMGSPVPVDLDPLAGGGWVLAFRANAGNTGGPDSEANVAVFGTSGELLKVMQLGTAYGWPTVSVDPLGNGGFVAAWGVAGKYQYGQSYVHTFDAAGNSTSGSVQLSTATSVFTAGVGSGGAYVVGYGSQLRYFDGASFKTAVDMPTNFPLLTGAALSDGKVVLLSTRHDGVEHDLYALTFDPATNLLSAPRLIHSDEDGFNHLEVLPQAGGGYVLSWQDPVNSGGARTALAVGPSGVESELFTLQGTVAGAFGPGEASVLTVNVGGSQATAQTYSVGPGEAPAQSLRADNTAGQKLAGGAGDDVFYAGQNSAVLTGNGGGDLFVFENLPWNSGRITDFAVGADRLDFSRLFTAAGYTGSDPQADGRLFFQADGAGGTKVYFDADGAGAQGPFLVTTLEDVATAEVSWSLVGGTSAGEPPPAPPPNTQVALTTNSIMLQEGNSGVARYVFNVTRTGDASGTSSVAWTVASGGGGSPVDAQDFAGGTMPSGTVTFAPGETGKTITVNVAGDTVVEWEESFILSLSNPTGATLGSASATGFIGNDDSSYQPPPPRFEMQASTVTKAEGNTGLTPFTFTVTRTGDSGATASVDWVVGGAGASSNPASPSDFENGAYPSGRLTFAPGETAKTITVQVAGDTALEADEVFVVNLTNAVGAAIGAQTASGVINNDDSSGDGGRIINSPGPGSTLTGGAGNDTLNASQGSDVLTGGGGADAFTWGREPWSPARVTDFKLGEDRLDLSALFRGAGYTGSDPIADKYVWLLDDGAGGTKLLFDRDGMATGQQWPNYIVHLQNVPTAGLTWAQLSTGSGGSEPPPPPPPTGQPGEVLTSDQYGDTLVGGAGDDTLNAGQGPDRLTGAGGADHFVYRDLPWNAGRISDFAPGVDKLDLRELFDGAGYAGSDPIADRRLEFRADGAGNTQVYFDRDAPGAGDWPFLITTLEGVTPTQIKPGDWLFA